MHSVFFSIFFRKHTIIINFLHIKIFYLRFWLFFYIFLNSFYFFIYIFWIIIKIIMYIIIICCICICIMYLLLIFKLWFTFFLKVVRNFDNNIIDKSQYLIIHIIEYYWIYYKKLKYFYSYNLIYKYNYIFSIFVLLLKSLNLYF